MQSGRNNDKSSRTKRCWTALYDGFDNGVVVFVNYKRRVNQVILRLMLMLL